MSLHIKVPHHPCDCTVVECGNWCAVYDETGVRLFEVPLWPLERGVKGSVAAALRTLGLEVAVRKMPVDLKFKDFPEHLT